jgi:hypothetical protein
MMSSKRPHHKHKLIHCDRAALPLVAAMLCVLAALPLSVCCTLAAVPLYGDILAAVPLLVKLRRRGAGPLPCTSSRAK